MDAAVRPFSRCVRDYDRDGNSGPDRQLEPLTGTLESCKQLEHLTKDMEETLVETVDGGADGESRKSRTGHE